MILHQAHGIQSARLASAIPGFLDPRFDRDVIDAVLEAIGSLDIALCVCDENDVIRYVSEPFRRKILSGLPQGQLNVEFSEAVRTTIRAGGGTRLESMSLDAFIERIRHRRRTMTGSCSFTTDLSDGGWMHVTDMKLDNGWLVAIAQDVSAIKHEELRLRQEHAVSSHEARTDFLTDIPNRRHGLHLSQRIFIDAVHAERSMMIAFVDIDHFKHINDVHGHEVGDQVLVHFARHMTRGLREKEIFCRTGGEEFLFASHETCRDRAMRRLHDMLGQVPAVDVAGGAHFTVSAGVAMLLPHESWPELLRRADKALYRAKAGGRNRIELAY